MPNSAQRRYDWVLFDLGGTLFDDLPSHYGEHNQRALLRELGADELVNAPQVRAAFSAARRDADARFLQQGAYAHKTLVATHALLALQALGLTHVDDWATLTRERPAPQHKSHCEPEKMVAAIDRYFERQAQSVITNVRIKPGCHDTLVQLAGEHQLAVVSNNAESYLRPLLRQYRLENLFVGAYTSDALGACKPNPQIFAHALEQLGIADLPRQKLLYVGDSLQHDVGGALAAGIDVALLVNSEERTTLQNVSTSLKPTYAIGSLPELTELLAY